MAGLTGSLLPPVHLTAAMRQTVRQIETMRPAVPVISAPIMAVLMT